MPVGLNSELFGIIAILVMLILARSLTYLIVNHFSLQEYQDFIEAGILVGISLILGGFNFGVILILIFIGLGRYIYTATGSKIGYLLDPNLINSSGV